ncbi:MAG: YgiT-type zinc finger protein [Caldilineaceae bacterium]
MNEVQEAVMVCEKCGKPGAKVRRVSKSYGAGETLLVIENVPVVSCPNCRSTYLLADTLQTVERIKLNRQALAEPRPVPVAMFA